MWIFLIEFSKFLFARISGSRAADPQRKPRPFVISKNSEKPRWNLQGGRVLQLDLSLLSLLLYLICNLWKHFRHFSFNKPSFNWAFYFHVLEGLDTNRSLYCEHGHRNTRFLRIIRVFLNPQFLWSNSKGVIKYTYWSLSTSFLVWSCNLYKLPLFSSKPYILFRFIGDS